ncbi:uncharacterized protein G2W53_041655 [Senna tora]|uniref:Uncharacterized protein n=1 Tax=Senna tora TaxID=362788 RepID=A0A834SSG6_9FABA|nr:uncharacterized protein G2W53_041655 [Senna tora]
MVGSQKPSRITRQKTCCASESNTFVRVVFANRSGFDSPIGVVLAWEGHGSCLNIFRMTNRGRISETFKNYEAKDLLRKSVDLVLTYFGRQIAVGFEKPSEITRQKTCCASESNTSVRVVFANRTGFDAPIAAVMAWKERGSCVDILRTSNPGQISGTFTNSEAKVLLRNDSNTSVHIVFANRSGLDAPIGVFLAWEECGSCLNKFRTKDHIRIFETFMNYKAKDLLRKGVDHVLTYFGRQIMVGSQKPSRITRQKTCCAREERGSCLNIFRTTNRGQISKSFTNYEAKDLLRKNLHKLRSKRLVAQVSETRLFALYLRTGVDLMLQLESSWHGRSVDHVLTYFGVEITVGSLKPSRITREKICCSIVMAWQMRGSCLNIFQMKNCGRISEAFTNYEAKHLLRKSVDHVLTYSGRKIMVGSQKPSRITRQKTCCASESNTFVRVVFANRSGFDAPIGVVLAWEGRGSCLNILRMTNRGRISETFTNNEEKTSCTSESNTSVRVVFANRSGFDAPIAVIMAWEERGPCLNIFRMTNCGQITETFRNYEAKDLLCKSIKHSTWHGRGVDHLLTYSGWKITVEPQKPSRIRRQKTCCASESITSDRVVFANRSGFDAPIGVVLAWEERGSCHYIFRRQIAVGSQKPSRIMRQKTCCASQSNTSVRVVFANRSGFDAPIAVVMAWQESGSCLIIFWMTNRGRISETFTNYETKDLLRQ